MYIQITVLLNQVHMHRFTFLEKKKGTRRCSSQSSERSSRENWRAGGVVPRRSACRKNKRGRVLWGCGTTPENRACKHGVECKPAQKHNFKSGALDHRTSRLRPGSRSHYLNRAAIAQRLATNERTQQTESVVHCPTRSRRTKQEHGGKHWHRDIALGAHRTCH